MFVVKCDDCGAIVTADSPCPWEVRVYDDFGSPAITRMACRRCVRAAIAEAFDQTGDHPNLQRVELVAIALYAPRKEV